MLHETIELFGDKTDAVLAQHHWPKWGQRDLYKYIHDQSLRVMNRGDKAIEIGEMLELPPSLTQEWYNRGYYSSVNHNAKAVYQRYLGWYDSCSANLLRVGWETTQAYATDVPVVHPTKGDQRSGVKGG